LDFLKEVAELENVKDSVDFLGFRKDIKEIMSRSSIFALPSRDEGFPCVLLEAMSQGCAPVAFEIRGNIKEIITDGYDGFLIPDGNLKMFAEKLDELIDKEDLRKKFRENARISLKRFEPEKIVDQWVEMFQEVIKKKKTDV
jgi:glycosyltransferase involved in cell wall biosynthesis